MNVNSLNKKQLIYEINRLRNIIDDLQAEHTSDSKLNSERQHSLLQSILNTLPDLVWLKDPDGVYLSCNNRFETFFNASKSARIKSRSFFLRFIASPNRIPEEPNAKNNACSLGFLPNPLIICL